MLWRSELGFVSLTGLLADLAPGWQLKEARAISADGHVVAGWGINPQGQTEAWRAELPTITLGVTPEVASGAALAVRAFPNPARGAVFVRATSAKVGASSDAAVIDLSGRVVRTLVASGTTGTEHDWNWDGRDGAGNRVAPGMYLVRVRVGDETRVGRVLRIE